MSCNEGAAVDGCYPGKCPKMLKFITMSLFMLMMTPLARAGYFSLNALENQFGFYLDTISVADQESLMLAKADSLHFAEKTERFDSYPGIACRGYFTRLPCISFYYLKTSSYVTGPEDPYKLIFYNHCDSAIYRYGGDIKNFNKVFGQYLFANFDIESTMKIIRLFLTTQYSVGPPRILWAPNDFEVVYDSLFPDVTILNDPFLFKCIEDDKLKAAEFIKPLKYKRTNEFQSFDFYTYGGTCKVVHWAISIFPDSLRLDKKETVMEHLAGCGNIR